MLIPSLKRVWNRTRNVTTGVLALVIVVALLPTRARSQLGPRPLLRDHFCGIKFDLQPFKQRRGSATRLNPAA